MVAEEKKFITQNDILKETRKKGSEATIILVNGVRLSGKIVGFDEYTIFLQTKKGGNLIYKHAISTII